MPRHGSRLHIPRREVGVLVKRGRFHDERVRATRTRRPPCTPGRPAKQLRRSRPARGDLMRRTPEGNK
eukprot:1438158-Lingulodinium_polyedra.AAC.1